MSEIYLADYECKVSASEALQEIDKQYLGWGWNTEQTTLDLVDYAKELERQLAEAREALNSIRGILPTVHSSDREIHEIINKVLKEQG